MHFDSLSLKRWFLAESRELPWRKLKDPYAVWVSEIMLQQTQVAVVIPYFERWMQTFPTIRSLALAPLDTVIKAWEGLGYYSRARNLHEGAQYIVEHYGGELPEKEEELKKIKGIGPYTVGAIMSFAFHKKKAAVDGNVLRVLARVFNIHEDIGQPKTVNRIRELVEEILPDEEPWIVMEALIELGATVCMKNPKCGACPLKSCCKSFLKGEENLLPIKAKKVKTTRLFRNALVVIAENKFLVKRGKKDEIMAGLYEFPFIETDEREENDGIKESEFLGLSLMKVRDLEEISHSFTRFLVKLRPKVYRVNKIGQVDGYEWLSRQELEQLAFSSGHRRLFEQVKFMD